jgi:hypothetical protein
VTASWDQTARLWDAQTGEPLGEPLRHTGNVNSASFSPDGTRVVTASHDGAARLWDTQTGAPLGEPLRHAGPVESASFSTDGTRVVTASHDGAARLWDAQTGAPLGEPLRHAGNVNSASFSPDGTRVVTASGGDARLWDIEQPFPGSEDGWKVLQVFTGLAVDDQGKVTEMAAAAYEQFRDAFLRRNEPWWQRTLELQAERRLRFRRQLLQTAEARGDWYAAAFHRGWLQQDTPPLGDPTVKYLASAIAGIAQAADKLRALEPKHKNNLYNAACLYARCAEALTKGKPEPSADELAERKKYLDLSLAALKESLAAGYDNFDHLQKDADLDPLRELPEFQALIEDAQKTKQ